MNPSGNSASVPSSSFKEKVPSGYKVSRVQTYTPEQMNLFRSMFGNVGPDSYLGRLAAGDQDMFSQLEAPAMRQFNELAGNLGARFSGASGSRMTGGRKSSGFQNAGSQAAADFAQQLQSQRMGLQRQALLDLAGMQHQLLGQNPYATQLVQKQQKQGWGGLIGTGLGAVGGALFGGPAGAMMGAQLGGSIGGSFSGGQAMNTPINLSGGNMPTSWSGFFGGGTPSTPGSMSGWGGGGALSPAQLQSLMGI